MTYLLLLFEALAHVMLAVWSGQRAERQGGNGMVECESVMHGHGFKIMTDEEEDARELPDAMLEARALINEAGMC